MLQGFYEQPGYVHHESDQGAAYCQGKLTMVQSFAKGRRLIDIGCGGGSFLAAARDLGYEVTGMEPSSQGRANVERQGIDVHASLAPLLEGKRRFDVVTLWHVLEHIPDLAQVLQDIRNLMDKDAVLLVAVPNIKSARAWLLGLFPSLSATDSRYRAFPIHLHAFSKRSLTVLMKRCGFQVHAITTRYIAVDDLFREIGAKGVPIRATAQGSLKPMKNNPAGRYIAEWVKKVFFWLCLGESLVVISKKASGSDPLV
jgi:SAM-dependent methyltransferase